MKYRVVAASILAVSLLTHPVSSLAQTNTFPDVPDWAEEAVSYLVDKNVISGMPDGTFGSNGTLTRAQAATIMAKVLGLQVNESAKPSFKDAQNHWATKYIAAAEKAGIIAGEGNGVFNPDGQVTRAAMAAMLVNTYKLDQEVSGQLTTKFADLKGHWGEKFANILVELNISVGTDDGWKPNNPIKRVEAAQLTAKTDMLKNGEQETEKMYIDRKFITYHQPSLSSGITSNQHNPQTVIVKEKRDGWIKIVTDKGDKWTPLKEKTEYIDKAFTTYQEASHSSKVMGKYDPQTVTVIEEKGSWIRIRVGDGFQWLDKNQLSQANFLEGKAIVIDPGHGGVDPGHEGVNMDESKIVLDTSLRVQKLFEQKTPFTVLLTRETDVRPGTDAADSLKERVEFAQENHGDIFVSIHGNGFDGSAQGTETYYYRSATRATNPHVDESRMLAEKIQDRLVDALGTRDRGVKEGDFYVVRENTMPAVLTELGFVDNQIEGEKLSSPEWRQRAAEAIYSGILDYYEWKGNDVSSYRL
ncbi:N-acetylmuramoyl-L-alanine amidase [Bacillus pseudomycoides]|uniref:N-acetylmuramoyl-L-alanine amidase n=1 Tax=Bacillus bingmayongensis TaxID=1150157 RepID=A0ABU5JRQ2_9BACI|nr:N-acetylmuramoyl-L-alanine amidase [Bacillus pseudomycoides]